MNKIQAAEASKKSILCVGLDPEITKLPKHIEPSVQGVFHFCKEIIEQTHDVCMGYKFNLAFFEVLGHKGIEILEKLLEIVPKDCITIADAKRGDIGNTALAYAKTFFETMDFDSITINPYMGIDTIEPYFQYKDKTVFVLALTSNLGSTDFEEQKMGTHFLFENVIQKTLLKESNAQKGFVVGATKPEYFKEIRKIAKNEPLLVPGIGAQGGDLEAVIKGLYAGLGTLLINQSRSIIYHSSGLNFAQNARNQCIDFNNSVKI